MNPVIYLVLRLVQSPFFAGRAVLWTGNWITRRFISGTKGICLVCNNLQPHGHENTYGRVGAGMFHHDKPRPNEHNKLDGVPALVLEKISTKALLRAREVRGGCRYCRLLCDVFDAFFVDDWMSWITETKNGMPIHAGLMIREGAPLVINCWNFTNDKYVLNPRADLELYTTEESALHTPGAPCMGFAGTRNEDVASPSCTAFVRDCVRQCEAEHPLCRPQFTGFTPSRLICIRGSDDQLAIHDCFLYGSDIRWAALSHCWGDGQPLKLLKMNIESLKAGINISDLPATFSDAITVARELNFDYIWIDSLCIIQDDDSDWQKESASMVQIYSHAVVVLTAASSPDPKTHFLRLRDKEWLPKNFEFETPQGVKLPLIVRKKSLISAPPWQGHFEPPFTSAWATLKRDGPLYRRAWCFQESFLALRNVQFAPGAIIFECRTHRRCEDQLPPYTSTVPGTIGEVSDMKKWQMIVKAYTQRQLTFAKDKLTAIGGSGKALPQAQRSDYLAGLWRESLLLDLLWQVMPGRAHEALTFSAVDRQRAPSWSWASMDQGVTWNPLKSPQLLAQVIHCSTNLVNPDNPYGEVNGGSLTIRGTVTPCTILSSRNQNEHWIYYHQKSPSNANRGTPSAKVHFRTDGQLMPFTPPGVAQKTFARRAQGNEWVTNMEAEGVFLCIARTPWRNYDYIGLVLSSSSSSLLSSSSDHAGIGNNDHENHYYHERVGSVARVTKDWILNGTDETVTII